MNLNIIVRGQSNSIYMMELDTWAGANALPREVARLLGFNGTADTVSLVYEAHDRTSATAFGGTALIGDWVEPRNGDWRQGWTNDELERAILAKLSEMPASQRDDPTATLWLHNEYDSANAALTPEQWVSAVRHDAAQVRGLVGQGAATTPYLFISAMPYSSGTDAGHQAIRRGMEQLAADGSFNGQIAARMLDIDADLDNWDNNPATSEFGGGHIDGVDAAQTVARAARAIAESFATYAKPGSPVAQAGGNLADEGPKVVNAQIVGSNQLRVDVRHDGASSFQALDADAARGVGWSVRGPGGTVQGTGAQIVDGDTLLLTFSGNLPTDGRLYYGWGYGRLAGQGGEGRGNAVYDNQGLPVWVAADGLAPTGTAPLPSTTPTTGNDSLTGTAGADAINALAGNDRVIGGDGADTITGGAGYDQMTGGAGADVFAFSIGDGAGFPHDAITDFQVGVDRVLFPSGVPLQIEADPGGLWIHYGSNLGNNDWVQLLGVQNATLAQLTATPALPPPPPPSGPTTGSDLLSGTSGADVINALAGNDSVSGGDGADTITGGPGYDHLTGGAGADVFVFSIGDGAGFPHDVITDFQVGIDKLAFPVGAPLQLEADPGGLWMHYGSNLGNNDWVQLKGVQGATITQLTGTAPLPSTTPTTGNDSLTGTAGADAINALAGNDRVIGGDGADSITGGAGYDQMTGGAGADVFAFSIGDGAGFPHDAITDFQVGVDRVLFPSGVPLQIEADPGGLWIHYGSNLGNNDWVQLLGVQNATLAQLTGSGGALI